MALKCDLSILENLIELKHQFRKYPGHLIHAFLLYLFQSKFTDSTTDLSERLLIRTRAIQHRKKLIHKVV
jgi:hypothetical protein